jgi:hypothetical protein
MSCGRPVRPHRVTRFTSRAILLVRRDNGNVGRVDVTTSPKALARILHLYTQQDHLRAKERNA